MQKQAIVCFLVRNDEILLAESDYRPGQKTWNGITGFITDLKKIEHETVKILFDAIKVQAYPRNLTQVGVMHLYDLNSDQTREETLTITIYTCEHWLGEPRLTGNFRPRWFDFTSIPYDEMFADTKDWLPRVLEGEKVIIEVLSQNNETTHQADVKDVLVRNIYE